MNLKAIFFDFDGVIAESVNVKTDAFYKMYLPYGQDIAAQVKQHHIENGGMSRFEKFRLYHKDYLGKTITEPELNELTQQFSDIVLQGVISAKYVLGITEFLAKNHKCIDFYVITGTPTTEIREILEARGISSYFKQAYGSPEKKGYWVKTLMDEHKYNSKEVVFIGDALADYEAANSNQIPFILREWEDNISLFKKINCPRITDFMGFDKLLESL